MPSETAPVTFETRDPEEARQFLAEAYAENHMSVAGLGEGFMLRHSRQNAGTFHADEYRNTMDVSYSTHPLGELLVGRLRAGRFERSSAGVTERLEVGDVYLVAEPDLPYTCRAEEAHIQLTGLDLTTVADVGGAEIGRGPGRLRLTGYRPVSPAAAARWQRTVDFVHDTLCNRAAAASGLVVGHAGRLLAATALGTFPNTAVDEPDPHAGADATPETLRRAIAFIEANASTDIGLADIAAAAYVTPRAIQYAFQRHRGSSPMTYLRRVRLAYAQRDLKAADPTSGETVTDVAARWGFAHPGRFAELYRKAYGQPPSRTLHS